MIRLPNITLRQWLFAIAGIFLALGLWTVWLAISQPSTADLRKQACERAALEPESATRGISADEAICSGQMQPGNE